MRDSKTYYLSEGGTVKLEQDCFLIGTSESAEELALLTYEEGMELARLLVKHFLKS